MTTTRRPPNETEQVVLNNILSLMAVRRVSAKELGEYLGVSPQTINNWKSGFSKSYMKCLPKVATYFDVAVSDLTTDREQAAVPASTISTVLDTKEQIPAAFGEMEQTLMTYFRNCDTSGKLRIIQTALNEFDRTQKEKPSELV